jgi:lipoyl-dependent peroxiredoxin
MRKIEKVLITGKTHTTFAGPPGAPKGHGSKLNLQLSSSLSATPAHTFENAAPHPTAEQFFAGAWSSCYTIALTVAAEELKTTLPAYTAVDIAVDLGTRGPDYYIQARLDVTIPGLSHDLATAIAHRADELCPYSKAVRGNIDVDLNILTN